MNLDVPTLSVVLLVSFFIQSLALWILYFNRGSLRGPLYWAIGATFIALRYSLHSMHTIPGLGSLFLMLSNLIFLYGLACIYVGVRHFFGKRLFGWYLLVGALLITVVYAFFTWGIPSPQARVIIFSAGMAVISSAIAMAFVRTGQYSRSPLSWLLGSSCLFQSLYWGWRAVAECLGGTMENPLGSLAVQVVLASYILTLLVSNIWTFGFLLLVARRLAEQNKEEKEYLHQLFELSPEAIVTTRVEDGRFIACNGRFLELTGYQFEELIERETTGNVFWSNPLAREDYLSKLLVSGSYQNYEARFRRKDGSLFYANLSSRILSYRGEDIVLTSVRDVSNWVETEQNLLRLTQALEKEKSRVEKTANTDALTGLANRRVFDETLEKELARARRSAAEVGLIMIDIDHFKKYNDQLGHQQGDVCLRTVAQGIAGAVKRAADLPARYGGEEFAVIVPESDPEGLYRLAEGIRQAIEALELPHPGVARGRVSVSLGVASVCSLSLNDPHTLVRCVDGALYEAKHRGRNRVVGASPFRLACLVRPESLCLYFGKHLCSGHPTIDAQHEGLAIRMNEILASYREEEGAASFEELAGKLLDEVARHFHDEEAILRAARWPGVERHSRIHWELERSLGGAWSSWRAGRVSKMQLVSLLVHDIIANHLAEEDSLFFKYVQDWQVRIK